MKTACCNIIVISGNELDNNILVVTQGKTTKEANGKCMVKAEQKFRQVIEVELKNIDKSTVIDEEDFNAALDEGYYDVKPGVTTVFMVWPTLAK